MIRKIKLEDETSFYQLGYLINPKFSSLYNLKDLLKQDYALIYVYVTAKKVVGFIHVNIFEDIVDIQNIAVLSEYQNQNIASNLITYLTNHLPSNVKHMSLEVNVNNLKALALYKKFDFKIKNIRKEYYHSKEDAYVMERNLDMEDVYILAIETSCDETSIAIVKNAHECIYMNVLTQMDTHANFGGVVPEIASRMHTENISMVLEDVLCNSHISRDLISAVAVTYGPGLMGSLLVGVESAKIIAYLLDKPLIAVNHMAGHIYANNLTANLEFPLLAIVLSGGHTNLIIMNNDYDFQIVGTTLDDAIGEAYDKVARVLGLKYPGGPNVEKLALNGKNICNLGNIKVSGYDMSYSGLKSSVINYVHNHEQKKEPINRADIACSFQTRAVAQIINKAKLVIKDYQIKNVILAGGVSANKYVRQEVAHMCEELNLNLSIPDFKYCTDNAAMIAAAAYPLYKQKKFASFSLNASSNASL